LGSFISAASKLSEDKKLNKGTLKPEFVVLNVSANDEDKTFTFNQENQ
tara:strand:+ start:604 stop:747 length:144 start_codon:yes stop_codon:yes gene_type:complete